MGLIKKLRNFSNYPLSFKRLLVSSLLESAKNEFFLKLKIYKPIKELHLNVDQNGPISESELIVLKDISKAMKLLEKFAPWRPKCYNRALTAKSLLSRQKIDTNLHIGFRKKDGKFDGHAWITYKGTFITGFLPGIQSFSELQYIK